MKESDKHQQAAYEAHVRGQQALGDSILLRMADGLFTQLAARAEYARLLRAACGIDLAQWDALDLHDREYVLAQGRRCLVRTAHVSRRAWSDMPPYGPERAAVLLKGAEALGIETTWAGWAGLPSQPS